MLKRRRGPGRKMILGTVFLTVASGIVVTLWISLDWPPLRLVMRHGFPPAGGPTGRRRVIGEIEFIELDSGYFRMGSHRTCRDAGGGLFAWLDRLFGDGQSPDYLYHRGECPTRWVEIRKPFWIAKTEVTRAQYRRWPGRSKRESPPEWAALPISDIEYREAAGFCEWLSGPGVTVRFPSEAEWEYACRAGSSGPWCFGEDQERLTDYAHCAVPFSKVPGEVGRLAPNAWGLHDMHGNVREFCSDDHIWKYEHGPLDERPRSRGPGSLKITRGGSARSGPQECRSATRTFIHEKAGDPFAGFRPVAEIGGED